MKKLIQASIFLMGTIQAYAAGCNDKPNPNSWTDSVSVNGKCYCATTFDHNIGGVKPAGYNGLTVRQICNKLGPAPAGNRARYNDIQCGNGPANNSPDEQPNCCPGRVDQGRAGCKTKGPKWDKNAVLGGGGNNGGGNNGGGSNAGLPANNVLLSIKGNNNRFMSSENGKASGMKVNRANVAGWEKFRTVKLANGKYALRGNNGKYVTVSGSTLVCNAGGTGGAAQFTMKSEGGGKFSFKASNGRFVSSENGNRAATANRTAVGGWEKFSWKNE